MASREGRESPELDPVRWRRVKELFHVTRDLEPDERDAFLRQACANDAELITEVLSLVAIEPSDSIPTSAVGVKGDEPASPVDTSILGKGSLGEGGESPTPLLVDGKYAIEGALGEGGMGVVYLARHVGLGRRFALKVVRSRGRDDPDFLARFRTEAAALGRLKHPGIVDVTDYGVDLAAGGLPYLVMEYLEGRTLLECTRKDGALDLATALPILESIAEALDFAHDHGVLHRDLKPANVLMSAGDARPKILDFGLARLQPDAAGGAIEGVAGGLAASAATGTGAGRTEPGRLGGTPGYMAPELFTRGEASRASDIYAFGVLAYEVLTGRPPFGGSLLEVMQGHLSRPPAPPSSACPRLPPEVDAPLLAALAKSPAQRPARGVDLVAGLRAAAQRAREREWRRREIPRRALLAVAVGALLAAGAMGFSSTEQGHQMEASAVDTRFAWRPGRAPDPRLVVVVVDDATLKSDPTPLAAKGEEFGERLARAFDAGARAVAIDLLLPRDWGATRPFVQLVLRHADRLTLAATTSPGGDVAGHEAVEGLTTGVLEPGRASALFGLVNLDEDYDGVVREGRLFFPEAGGGRRLSWAGQAASTLAGRVLEGPEVFWIDRTIQWERLPRISWAELPRRLEKDPDLLRGKLVLVGASFIGSGDERLQGSTDDKAVPGVVLQAMIVDTILSGFPYREPPNVVAAVALAMALIVVVMVALMARRFRSGILAYFVATAAVSGLALILFQSGWIVPVAAPLAALVVGLLAGLVLRNRLPAYPGRA